MTTNPITAEDVIEAVRRLRREANRPTTPNLGASADAVEDALDHLFRLLTRYEAQQKEKPRGR